MIKNNIPLIRTVEEPVPEKKAACNMARFIKYVMLFTAFFIGMTFVATMQYGSELDMEHVQHDVEVAAQNAAHQVEEATSHARKSFRKASKKWGQKLKKLGKKAQKGMKDTVEKLQKVDWTKTFQQIMDESGKMMDQGLMMGPYGGEFNSTNSTLPVTNMTENAFENATENATVGSGQCNASDIAIFNRESAECVQRDPLFGTGCLLTKFDKVVSGDCELQCQQQLAQGSEPFAKCLSQCIEETEKLSAPCSSCFGNHSWAVCTKKKAERAAVVCNPTTGNMEECSKLLMEKCLPELRDCTGLQNLQMPARNEEGKLLSEAAMEKKEPFQMPKTKKVPTALAMQKPQLSRKMVEMHKKIQAQERKAWFPKEEAPKSFAGEKDFSKTWKNIKDQAKKGKFAGRPAMFAGNPMMGPMGYPMMGPMGHPMMGPMGPMMMTPRGPVPMKMTPRGPVPMKMVGRGPMPQNMPMRFMGNPMMGGMPKFGGMGGRPSKMMGAMGGRPMPKMEHEGLLTKAHKAKAAREAAAAKAQQVASESEEIFV